MLLWISFRGGMKTPFTGRITLTLRRIPILKPGYDLDLASRSVPPRLFVLTPRPPPLLLTVLSFFPYYYHYNYYAVFYEEKNIYILKWIFPSPLSSCAVQWLTLALWAFRAGLNCKSKSGGRKKGKALFSLYSRGNLCGGAGMCFSPEPWPGRPTVIDWLMSWKWCEAEPGGSSSRQMEVVISNKARNKTWSNNLINRWKLSTIFLQRALMWVGILVPFFI